MVTVRASCDVQVGYCSVGGKQKRLSSNFTFHTLFCQLFISSTLFILCTLFCSFACWRSDNEMITAGNHDHHFRCSHTFATHGYAPLDRFPQQINNVFLVSFVDPGSLYLLSVLMMFYIIFNLELKGISSRPNPSHQKFLLNRTKSRRAGHAFM